MANRQTRWTLIAAGAVHAIVILVNFYGWITRDPGYVDPFEANLQDTVRVVESPDGECLYDYIND